MGISLRAVAILFLVGSISATVVSAAEPYLVTKAKQLRGIADTAQADLDAANALLQQRQAEEAPFAQKAAAADAEAAAATTELNNKRAELEASKVEQETARQALIQAKQNSRDERSYYDDLESQAEEALFEESEAAKDVLDAISRQNTTAVVLSEQQKISTEAYNDAVAAARSAARLETPEAKALQTELYNVKLQADRILGAVKKQSDRAVQRVSERQTESEKVKKDKSDTRGAANEQKVIKEKAEKDEADSNVFFTKAIGKTKNLDTAVKAAGQNYNAKVKAQRDAKIALAPKANARAAQERTVAVRKTRADAAKGNADNSEKEARGKGLNCSYLVVRAKQLRAASDSYAADLKAAQAVAAQKAQDEADAAAAISAIENDNTADNLRSTLDSMKDAMDAAKYDLDDANRILTFRKQAYIQAQIDPTSHPELPAATKAVNDAARRVKMTAALLDEWRNVIADAAAAIKDALQAYEKDPSPVNKVAVAEAESVQSSVEEVLPDIESQADRAKAKLAKAQNNYQRLVTLGPQSVDIFKSALDDATNDVALAQRSYDDAMAIYNDAVAALDNFMAKQVKALAAAKANLAAVKINRAVADKRVVQLADRAKAGLARAVDAEKAVQDATVVIKP
ncbi:unnamed protein product [Closterium sp. Naga37s-1]|nr:unnamed protein product [Closterium sp. Naga37s-1]